MLLPPVFSSGWHPGIPCLHVLGPTRSKNRWNHKNRIKLALRILIVSRLVWLHAGPRKVVVACASHALRVRVEPLISVGVATLGDQLKLSVGI